MPLKNQLGHCDLNRRYFVPNEEVKFVENLSVFVNERKGRLYGKAWSGFYIWQLHLFGQGKFVSIMKTSEKCKGSLRIDVCGKHVKRDFILGHPGPGADLMISLVGN